MFTLPLALGRLGVENCLRHRSLLGALVLRACHVIVRSWVPLCEELLALPIAFLGAISAPFLETVWTRKRTEAPKRRPKDPSEGDSKKYLF